LEYKTIKLLESAGYQCIRSAASLGPFDIIAAGRQGFRCIQVKANRWPGSVELEGLRMVSKSLPVNTTVECWRWDDNARAPLIKHIDEFN